MGQEPRKATDVLLDLEAKLDTLLNLIKAYDLNIKVLSNKVNEIMKVLEKQAAAPPKVVVEAVQAAPVFHAPAPTLDPERSIAIKAESRMPVDTTPQGFRRTSRPESFTGNVPIKEVPPTDVLVEPGSKPPPGRSMGEPLPQPFKEKAPTATKATATHDVVPVEQRVVNNNGKPIFLADVEVVDVDTNEQVSKSRTNGMGKWMAALPVGDYRVTIKKMESVTGSKIESTQSVHIDGTQSPLKLPMVIIK